MLDLKHSFGLFGRIFGVPRKFLSQVGAFCASMTSGHSIISVNVPAFPDPVLNPVKIGIDETNLKSFIENCVGIASGLDWSEMFEMTDDSEYGGQGYNNILWFHAPEFDGEGKLTGFATTGVEIFRAAGPI